MGPLIGYGFDKSVLTTRLFVDVVRKAPLPFLPIIDGMLEGAIGSSGNKLDGALGLYLGIPWFYAGVDYDFLENNFPFRMSLQLPIRRGGLFGVGDMLRVDYQPSGNELLVGLTFHAPIKKYRQTRPRVKEAGLPDSRIPDLGSRAPPPGTEPDLERSLEAIEHSIVWMDRMLTPSFLPGEQFAGSAESYRDHIRVRGHTFVEEEATYHRELIHAFTLAVDGNEKVGESLATLAESLLFDDVIVPFNQRFGQTKRPAHAGGFCNQALSSFESRVGTAPYFAALVDSVSQARRSAAGAVFQRVLKTIENTSLAARDRWRETFLLWDRRSELAWLPLNYGLRPHQYDSQPEWDDVIAKLTGQPFEEANLIKYLMFEQFHLQLKMMIRDASYYQVTIVHDFRGQDGNGDTDIFGWDMVADGYIAAFTEAIRELDEGRRTEMPQYFLFLDEHYYLQNKSHDLITFLENLYLAEVPKLRNKPIRRQVEAFHEELIEAIHSSPALDSLSEEQLSEIFKVNINITNPFDPTFAMDVTMRDHRKIGFRDVFEDNPLSGAAIFTGQGIGGHYNGSAWEDRSLMVQGTALIQLKTGTRRLFMSQGFKEEEVPEYLQAREYPDDYAERIVSAARDSSWVTTPVSINMNETGYGEKKASILKAAMYNLAPKRSILLCFDSLWISDFWSGMFIGAALRGARMFPVAPSPANAPSSGTAALYFLRQNLQLLFQAQQYFDEELKSSEGMLRVGIYAHEVPVDDIERRMKSFIDGRKANPFLERFFTFDPSIEVLLDSISRVEQPVSRVQLQLRERPLLHLKNQFFGTEEAFRVVKLKEWLPVLAAHITIRRMQLMGLQNPGITPNLMRLPYPGDPDGTNLITALEKHLDSLSTDAKQRAILTFTIGSHNQNPRSLLLDGEVLVAVSGYGSLVTAIDCMFIMGITSWPATAEEFDHLYPEIEPSSISKMTFGILKDQL
jgi:hypothetical protein